MASPPARAGRRALPLERASSRLARRRGRGQQRRTGAARRLGPLRRRGHGGSDRSAAAPAGAEREHLLAWLDERIGSPPVSVLTTIRHHRRDRELLAERYAGRSPRAWNAVPAGVVPKPLRGAGRRSTGSGPSGRSCSATGCSATARAGSRCARRAGCRGARRSCRARAPDAPLIELPWRGCWSRMANLFCMTGGRVSRARSGRRRA